MATKRRQAAWSKEEIYVNIESSKKSLGDEYRRCRKAAADLASAKKRYLRAVEVHNKRSTNGSAIKLDSATDALSYVYGELVQVKRNMTSLYNFIEEQYQALEDMTAGRRKRTRIRLSAMRFADEFRVKSKRAIGDAEVGLPDFLADYSEPELELDGYDESETVADDTARAASADVGVASVSLAPVTIDISEIVERSVSAAVDKLTAKLNKKIEEYIDGLVLPVPLSISCVSAPAPSSEICAEPEFDAAAAVDTEIDSVTETGAELDAITEEVAALPAAISASDAAELDARITDGVGSIARILDELERLNAACLAIAEGQQQLAQLQKQTNDVQRHTMREQKGVQVSQRLVSSEQVELAADQAVIADRQAKLNADYKALSDVQNATEEAQRAISDAQHELLSTVKRLSRKQRAMAQPSGGEKEDKKQVPSQ